MAKKREDPEFLKSELIKMNARRKDPIYKAKEIEYMKKYCQDNNMSMVDLWSNICKHDDDD